MLVTTDLNKIISNLPSLVVAVSPLNTKKYINPIFNKIDMNTTIL